MPKVIDNLNDKIIEEVGREIKESSYSLMTIRSIANGCDIAVGTLYNYYRSKESMVGAYMASEWEKTSSAILVDMRSAQNINEVFECTFRGLSKFKEDHDSLFKDNLALQSFIANYRQFHPLLVKKVAELFEDHVKEYSVSYNRNLSAFIAEGMINWAIEGKSVSEFNAMLSPLFKS